MGLILRRDKGDRLTIQEGDDNFSYLEITQWGLNSYSVGQFVFIIDGDLVKLYRCVYQHGAALYSLSNNEFSEIVNETVLWVEIANNFKIDNALVDVIYEDDALTFTDLTGGTINIPITSGGGNYTNTNPTTVKVGGVVSGLTFDNIPISEIFDVMFYEYIPPAISLFDLTTNGGVPYEVGQPLNEGLFEWESSNSENILTGTTQITGIISGGGEGYIVQDYNYNAAEYTWEGGLVQTNPTTLNWEITIVNSTGGTYGSIVSLEWTLRSFWGISSDPNITESDILNFTEVGSVLVNTMVNIQRSFGTNYSYRYFVIPASFEQPSLFRDVSTSLPIPFEDAYSVTVMNPYSVSTNYSVYRSTNQITTNKIRPE